MFGWLSFRKCRILVSAECWTFFTATNSWLNLPTKTAPCAPEPSHCRSEIPSKGISQSSGTKKSHILKNHWKNSYQKNRWLQILLLALPNLAITFRNILKGNYLVIWNEMDTDSKYFEKIPIRKIDGYKNSPLCSPTLLLQVWNALKVNFSVIWNEMDTDLKSIFGCYTVMLFCLFLK